MYLNVATNFDQKYLDEVSKFKEVTVLFGKLPSDCIGGGVETSKLQDISDAQFETHILEAKKRGILFNYVINTPSMNNHEFTEEGRKQLNNLLEYLSGFELESITVSNPYLIRYIKKNFKNIPIKASSILLIDSVEKARHVKNMGADILVIDALLINRNFDILKSIRKAIDGEIEIMLNNNCLSNCPYLTYHQCFLGNNSRNNHYHHPYDFSYTNCSNMRLKDPAYWLKGDWIRPEDLDRYEEIGYERFKITDRSAPTDVLIKRIEAYVNRSYDGNLLDLILHYCYNDSILPEEYLENIYIDNKKLDGYIDFFLKNNCKTLDCTKCTHCNKYAKSAIHVNQDFINEMLNNKRNELEEQLSIKNVINEDVSLD